MRSVQASTYVGVYHERGNTTHTLEPANEVFTLASQFNCSMTSVYTRVSSSSTHIHSRQEREQSPRQNQDSVALFQINHIRQFRYATDPSSVLRPPSAGRSTLRSPSGLDLICRTRRRRRIRRCVWSVASVKPQAAVFVHATAEMPLFERLFLKSSK